MTLAWTMPGAREADPASWAHPIDPPALAGWEWAPMWPPEAKARKVKPPKVPAPRPPSHLDRILEVLHDGPVSVRFIAGATGLPTKDVGTYLVRLRDRGRVVCYGLQGRSAVWGLAW